MQEQPAALEAEVAQVAQELGVPGAAVGVDHRGEREIVTYGVTSVDHGRPVDESTLFQIGSTAKTFTATAIMVLVEQGRIELDRPVRRYLPELRLRDDSTAETLTVGQLLNHTAGWDGGDAWTDTGEGDDALERSVALLADLPQQFAAGTGASYNNAAFVLAGRVVEKVTGETFERALARLVLDPLGLRQTMTSLNEIMTQPFAVGHRSPGSADADGVGVPAVERPAWLPAGRGSARLKPRRPADLGAVPAGRRPVSRRHPTALRASAAGDARADDEPRVAARGPDRYRVAAPRDRRRTAGRAPRRRLGSALERHRGPRARLRDRRSDELQPDRPGAGGTDRAPDPGDAARPGRTRTRAAPARSRGVGSVRGDLPHRGHRAAGRRRRRGLVIHGTVSDDDAPGETLEFPVSLLAGERFLVVDGPFTGMQGEFVHEAGVVVAVRHVGRLVPRTEDPS